MSSELPADGRGRPAQDSAGRFNLVSQTERGWIERAEACVDMIEAARRTDPSIVSLADIGCGDAKLQRTLAARGVPVHYAGYDLLPQNDAIRRFDLAVDTLGEPVDLVVLLGVCEYLADFVGALSRLRTACRHLILSHVLRSPKSPSAARLAELGWVNHFTEAELGQALAAAGYRVGSRRMTPDAKSLIVHCQPMVADR